MTWETRSSLVMAAAFIVIACMQAYFINTTDSSMFASLPLAVGYSVMLLAGVVAGMFFLAVSVSTFIKERPPGLRDIVGFIVILLMSLAWNLLAFMQWHEQASRGLLAAAGLVTCIRLVQWLIIERDYSLTIHEPTDSPLST